MRKGQALSPHHGTGAASSPVTWQTGVEKGEAFPISTQGSYWQIVHPPESPDLEISPERAEGLTRPVRESPLAGEAADLTRTPTSAAEDGGLCPRTHRRCWSSHSTDFSRLLSLEMTKWGRSTSGLDSSPDARSREEPLSQRPSSPAGAGLDGSSRGECSS